MSPYPHKFQVDLRIPEFVSRFGGLEDGQTLGEVTVAVAGRVMAMRTSSSKLQFYDLHGEGAKIQVMFNQSGAESEAGYVWVRDNLRRGDIVGVTGHPGKSKKGELSIFP